MTAEPVLTKSVLLVVNMPENPPFTRSTVASRAHLAFETCTTPASTCPHSHPLRFWTKPRDYSKISPENRKRHTSQKSPAVVKPSSHVSVNRTDFQDAMGLLKNMGVELRTVEDEKETVSFQLENERLENARLKKLFDGISDVKSCAVDVSDLSPRGVRTDPMRRKGSESTSPARDDAGQRNIKLEIENRRMSALLQKNSEVLAVLKRFCDEVRRSERPDGDVVLDGSMSELQFLKWQLETLVNEIVDLRQRKTNALRKQKEYDALEKLYTDLRSSQADTVRHLQRANRDLQDFQGKPSTRVNKINELAEVRMLERCYDALAAARVEVNQCLRTPHHTLEACPGKSFATVLQEVNSCFQRSRAKRKTHSTDAVKSEEPMFPGYHRKARSSSKAAGDT